jgi:hypothetical protein
MPRSGLNEKDDPRSGYYMKYSAMREMPRKQQMLLISTRDKEKLSGELRSDARVLTWEELARMQVEIFSELSPASVRPIVLERLSAHHHSLGLGQAGVRCNSSEWDMDWNASEHPDSLRDWLKGCQSFFSARELDGIPAPPFEWLNEEPRREVLLGSKRQTTRHREMPLWKVP